MSGAAKEYFVTVGDEYLRVGRITASKPSGPEDTEMAVQHHKKCHDEMLKIFNPVDNEPTFNYPRCTIHLHVDIETAKISINIMDDKTGREINYERDIENI